MKKLLSAFLLTSLVVLAGCGSGNELPKKGTTKQENMCFAPKSVEGYVGDPMPFYDNGEMNIFYLQDGRNYTLGYHPFALMKTKDYIHYEDLGEVMPFINELESPDLALGTGSVIKDKNGLYHCYYTGHNERKNVGLPFYEIIQHATSQDKIHWNKIPADGFYGGNNDFRDPYVYLGEDDIYHMLITTRDNNLGVIKEYTSNDLSKWDYKGIFFKNDSGSYNMECSTFIKYNDYYYLSYSEQGSNRVMHYRYKKNLNDDWIKPEVDTIDSKGFYAGRIEKDEAGLVAFGWCGTRVGEYDTGEFDWGGNLICHRVTQKENGELNATMSSSVKEALSTEVSYSLANGNALSSMEFDSTKMASYQVEKLSKKITRISFDIEMNSLKGSLGLSFNTTRNNLLSNEIFAINLDAAIASYYCNAQGFSSFGKADASIPVTLDSKSIHVDMVIEGQVITAYINNERALTTRFYDMKEKSFSFFNKQADAKFTNIKFFE